MSSLLTSLWVPVYSQVTPFLLYQQPLELPLLLPPSEVDCLFLLVAVTQLFFYLPNVESKQPLSYPLPQKQTQCPSEVFVHVFVFTF